MKDKKTPKTMLVLGSTGSVGEQALDVVREEGVTLLGISAQKNVKRVEEQVREFHPRFCAMADENAARELKRVIADTDTVVYAGESGICEMIREANADVVENSIIGEAGLLPTLAAIDTGKRLALANKESLVVAGEIVMSRAREKGVEVLPVDSEHCAIAQCLAGSAGNSVRRILLTASGGPFYGKTREELSEITVERALAHPTWKMGAKITVDSATLMNKGFEVIEAVHLFGVSPDRVEVVVQRESIIHSMVEYIDHSVIAQLSVPDMRLCVQYALTAPHRNRAVIEPIDFTKLGTLTFGKPDLETFVLLDAAYRAVRYGGALPAVLNAANEVAVAAFLAHKIGFTDIMEVVTGVLSDMEGSAVSAKSLDEILLCDREARADANERILRLHRSV
ncbi:MAG: 1-deoxy-D-xylulose-5-phosphate reductoisomerase [Clostridia bacterium]|nr:1-deoxy-D-xylulose-5-phosphate reductoisomerase [Clostridia bacterium]